MVLTLVTLGESDGPDTAAERHQTLSPRSVRTKVCLACVSMETSSMGQC